LKAAEQLQNQRFEIPSNTGYQIKPGVRLPSDPGVYAFDGARVIHLIQDPAKVVTDKKRIALIMVNARPAAEEAGAGGAAGTAAAVRITVPQPVFTSRTPPTGPCARNWFRW